MSGFLSVRIGLLVLLSALIVGVTWAQEADTAGVEELRERYRIDTDSERFSVFEVSSRAIFPGTTINTPTAFGARLGQVYGGVSYQRRTRNSNRQDGIAVVGAGFGSAKKWIGVDVTLTSLDTYTDLGEDWSVSLKVHRSLPYKTAVALGHENIWHTDGTDGGSSAYAVISKIFRLRSNPGSAFSFASVSVGLGNDRFLPEDKFLRDESGVNVFGSLGFRLHPSFNGIANWTGQDLALGLSITPFPKLPLVITPALMDVAGTAGDGVRFSASVSFLHDFR